MHQYRSINAVAQVVQAKIDNQARALQSFSPESKVIHELKMLRKNVRSGDPKNIEAQAARGYWRALMGNHFRRDRRAEDANIYLNYGYTVLRAATARAVCGSGLHPALGIHHGSKINPFALVDDLMEPFRPLIDSIVRSIRIVLQNLELSKTQVGRYIEGRDDIGEQSYTRCERPCKLAQSLVASLAQKSLNCDCNDSS